MYSGVSAQAHNTRANLSEVFECQFLVTKFGLIKGKKIIALVLTLYSTVSAHENEINCSYF